MSGKGKDNSDDNIFFNFESLENSCKNMTVPELKKELQSRDLKVSGRKTFLVKRLLRSKLGEVLITKTSSDLSIELKNKGLSVSGTKYKKIERLTEHLLGSDNSSVSESNDYSKMTISQLKKELKSKGLTVSGNKATLIKRLRTNDTDALEINSSQNVYVNNQLSVGSDLTVNGNLIVVGNSTKVNIHSEKIKENVYQLYTNYFKNL